MALHVSQRLLGDAEQRLGLIVRQVRFLAGHAQIGLHAGPCLEGPEHVLQRADQPQRLCWISAQGLDGLPRFLQPLPGQR